MPRAASSGSEKLVEVVLLWPAGIEFFADTLEARRERERGGEIGVAGGIGVAALATPAAHWHADGVGAVVCAERIEHGCPRVIRHEAAAHEALVAVDGRRERRADGTASWRRMPAMNEYAIGVSPSPRGSSFGSQAKRFFPVLRSLSDMLKCAPLPVLSGKGLGMNVASRPLLPTRSAWHIVRRKNVAVAHGEGVAVVEIEFELRIGVLVVEAVEIPAKRALMVEAILSSQPKNGRGTVSRRSNSSPGCRRDLESAGDLARRAFHHEHLALGMPRLKPKPSEAASAKTFSRRRAC